MDSNRSIAIINATRMLESTPSDAKVYMTIFTDTSGTNDQADNISRRLLVTVTDAAAP